MRPAIRALQGHARRLRPLVKAVLQDAFEKRGDRRQFVRAVVEVRDGAYQAHLTGPQGSHVLTSVARANAFLDLPAGQRSYAPGTAVDALLLEEGEAYAGRDPHRQ